MRSEEEVAVSKVLVRNSEGKFLAIKESEDREKDTAGMWEIPGGKIKPDEDRFEAASRELMEEVAIDTNTDDAEDIVRIEIESDHLVSCYIIYFNEHSGEPQISEDSKHSEFRWVSAEEFLSLDWHSDAGYDIAPMRYFKEYREKDKNYQDPK